MFHFLHLFGDCCTCKSLLLFITLWDRHGMSQALFEQGPLNHWLHAQSSLPKVSSTFVKGIALQGHCPTCPRPNPAPRIRTNWILRGDQINCDQLRNPTQHLALAIAAISAAWLSDDLPLDVVLICTVIYIYVRSVSQWQLSAWKIWKWFTLWKCSKYVLLFINYDLLEFMINVAIEIFFAPSPQMAPGGSRPPGGSGSSWLRQCLSDRYGRSYCSMPDTQMTDFHHQSWEFKHPKMWVNHQEGGVHQKNVI